MKRFLSVLLALVCLLSACASAELVSTPVQVEAAASDAPIVQDMYSYMKNRMSFENIGSGSGYSFRKFRGKDAYTLIDGYVSDLCSNGSFKLVDSYYQSYKTGFVSFSYALDYTGSAKLTGSKQEMNFVSGVYGDITIWATKRTYSSSYEGYIQIVKGLEFDDLGLRVDGQNESVGLPGESVNADLYRMDDGSYQTGDGRFHVNVGQAQVYRDGELFTVDASLVRNQASSREEVRIYNFYRNDSILFTVPYNSVLTGDILDRKSIGVNKDGGYEKYIDDMEQFLNWRFSDKLLGVSHDGDRLLLYCDDYNDFEDAVVRVMYWDPSYDVAVFYVCTTFETAPYTYEAVAAVSMGSTPQGAKADAVYTMNAGEEMQISFDATEFMPTYELFMWEILEGSSLIELSNTRSKTCTVRAYDPGTVRLKVTYEYGAEGTNVLTGLSETKFLSKTREYVITISK